jgi:hypothetical protein
MSLAKAKTDVTCYQCGTLAADLSRGEGRSARPSTPRKKVYSLPANLS